MRADRLLLVLRALALKSLVFSCFTMVDVIVDSLAIANLIMAERQDTCMGYDLLACGECIVERQNALDLDAFGPFAREFCSGYPLVYLPQLVVLCDGLPDDKDLP